MFFAPSAFARTAHPFAHSLSRGLAAPAYVSGLWSDSLFNERQDTPHVTVDPQDSAITLSLDVPGLAKEHLTIGIEGRVVRIAAKDDAPRHFKAAYQLAGEIDASQSEAKLENGVLTLKLAKLAPVNRETLLTVN